jgi:hypothetical protein
MMRKRKEPGPELRIRWVRPAGGLYRGTGPRVGLPPTTPATAEGFRRREREERERAEAEHEAEERAAGG